MDQLSKSDIGATDEVIVVSGLCKAYPTSRSSYFPVLYGRPPRASPDDIQALENINFSIKRGEIVGVIGHNGAGKSTLLRLLASLSRPTSGSIHVKGTVGSLLDTSAGFLPWKSGIWNIHRRLELLRVPQDRREAITDEIIEFSELNDVIHDAVGTYSTGMGMRLGFTLSSAIRPDVLLIDEALAVGDEFFAAKSFRRIEALASSGCTSIIVSHDWTKIFRLSSRVLWMEKGQLKADNAPQKLLYPFLASINAFRLSGHATVESVKLLDDQNQPCSQLTGGAPLTLEVRYRKDANLDAFAVISGATASSTGESVLSAWSLDDQVTIGQKGQENGVFRVRYPEIPLCPGEYDFSLMLVDPLQGPFPVDYLDIWGPVTGGGGRIVVSGNGQVFERNNPLISIEPNWEVHSV